MTTQTFVSQPDPTGQRTHIVFNPARGCIAGIELRNAQNQLVYRAPLKALTTSSFAIVFRKFDLANIDNNQHFLGEVAYRISQNKSPNITSGAGWVNYRYAVSPSNTPPEAGQPALPQFDAIHVDVKLSAPTGSSKGWVDLDVQFTYPAQAQNGDANTAWEVRLVYPELLLDGTAADHQLLNPVGVLGSVAYMLAHQHTAAPDGFNLPAQFAALYRLGDGAASAQGFALSATDETGHEKRLHLEARGSDTALSLRLITPIFLKGGAYVRPAAFKLSAGDALGYGGAKMTFRLRAFHLQSNTPEGTLGWHDVADLYRQWARTRTNTFWRKHNAARQTNAPRRHHEPLHHRPKLFAGWGD
ncbi:MAG: hypothetical protein HC853_01685 [Anaerolineae bacterium]|nr:hypothetical protein [Anaerolineae bacterium]